MGENTLSDLTQSSPLPQFDTSVMPKISPLRIISECVTFSEILKKEGFKNLTEC